MSFSTNSYEQLGFRDALMPLNDRERRVLDASWARAFSDEIFPFIDERGFGVLYSARSSPPNVPVNVLIGAMLLKAAMDLTDKELVEACLFDLRFQTALRTTGRSNQPISERTLTRFRSRISAHKRGGGGDLIAGALQGLTEKLSVFAGTWFPDRADAVMALARGESLPVFEESIPEDPTVFKENVLPAHSDHFFFRPDLAPGPHWEAHRQRREDTGFVHSLNGLWKFAFAKNRSAVPRGFEKKDLDCHAWAQIPVPAHIQMEGYDRPAYVNYQYPWDGREDIRPGEIPEDYNPVGCYVRYFTLPAFMAGKKVRISFQGVESGFALWLNGLYVGYSEDSFTPSEFDLTPFLTEGENKLALEVFQWTASSWMEDQDFYRFSGIFRDVFLYTVPDLHVRHLEVSSLPDEDLAGGLLKVLADLEGSGEGAVLSWTLSLEGEGALSGSCPADKDTVLIEERIEAPRLWSAEDPVLYDLCLTLEDGEGQALEVVREKVGFRRFEMKDGLLCLNGKRIEFCGVNRHEFSCDRGRAAGFEEALSDVLVMKRNNINAVRTCHYPNASWIYRLCDAYGLYMIAENNMESHGSWNLYEAGFQRREDIIPGDHREWEPMLLDRITSCVTRDRNHPSVLIWSLGNESFGGSVIHAMMEKVRSLDPSRPIHYEGIFHDRSYPDTSDMESQMYPPAEDIERFLRENPDKPFICCEYSHAMGNSCGGMQRYTDLQDREPRYQGGFIWDFVDQAIRTKDPFGREALAYGGDHGERPTDYAFSGNGLLTADRRPYAKLRETFYNYRRIRASLEAAPEGDALTVRARVRNRFLFTDTETFSARLTASLEGREVFAEECRIACPPLDEREVLLPSVPVMGPGEYALTLSFALKEDTPWADRGHEVSFAQTILRLPGEGSENLEEAPSNVPLRVIRGDYNIGIRGPKGDFLYSYLEGNLTSWRVRDREMILSAPRPNFWRAPVSNDLGSHMPQRLSQWKLASLYNTALPTGEEEERKLTAAGALRPLPEADGEDILLRTVRLLPTCPAAEAGLAYRFHPDGSWSLTLTWEGREDLPEMPEFGLLFTLPADFDRIRWYGLGPFENHCDRKEGARLGIYETDAVSAMEPYLVPQETGNRTGVRWAEVRDPAGRGWRFACSLPGGMNFSAVPYTPDQLEAAAHPWELPPRCHTIVRCSLVQMGVGGDDSWGALPLPETRIPAERKMTFTVTIRALDEM